MTILLQDAQGKSMRALQALTVCVSCRRTEASLALPLRSRRRLQLGGNLPQRHYQTPNERSLSG